MVINIWFSDSILMVFSFEHWRWGWTKEKTLLKFFKLWKWKWRRVRMREGEKREHSDKMCCWVFWPGSVLDRAHSSAATSLGFRHAQGFSYSPFINCSHSPFMFMQFNSVFNLINLNLILGLIFVFWFCYILVHKSFVNLLILG